MTDRYVKINFEVILIMYVLLQEDIYGYIY